MRNSDSSSLSSLSPQDILACLVPQRKYIASRQPISQDSYIPRRVLFTSGGVLGVKLDPASAGVSGLDDPDDRSVFAHYKQQAHFRIEVSYTSLRIIDLLALSNVLLLVARVSIIFRDETCARIQGRYLKCRGSKAYTRSRGGIH